MVDVICNATTHELYPGTNITMVGCTDADLAVKFRGCIPKSPEKQWRFIDVIVNTVRYQLYLFQCDTSDDCSVHGWCDNFWSDVLNDRTIAGHCRECPYQRDHCDNNNVYKDSAACKAKCFPEADAVTGAYEPIDRDSCEGTKGTDDTWTFSDDD